MKILPIDQIWANELRYCREKEKLTAKEVSEMTGIPFSSISKYELGRTIPRNENRNKLNELFNIDMGELTTRLAKNGLNKSLDMHPVINRLSKKERIEKAVEKEEREKKEAAEEQAIARFNIMNEITSMMSDDIAKSLIVAKQLEQLSVVMSMPFDVLNITFKHIKREVDEIRNYEPTRYDVFSFVNDGTKDYVIAHVSKTSNDNYGIIYFDFRNGEFKVYNTMVNKNEIRYSGRKFKETDFKTVYNAQLKRQREVHKFNYSPK